MFVLRVQIMYNIPMEPMNTRSAQVNESPCKLVLMSCDGVRGYDLVANELMRCDKLGRVGVMTKESAIRLFNDSRIRVLWDEDEEKWYFSIVDVVAVLTSSINPQAYWRKLKERLKKEGNESVTNCHALKMIAADGKMRNTDVADIEQILRLIQSIPSPNAEPFKTWLAQVGNERINETADPELAEEWVLDIKEECERQKVLFYFKQWGGVNKKKADRMLCFPS